MRDLHEAVFRAFYAQSNASLQQYAIAPGGTVTHLAGEEALQSEVRIKPE